MQELDQSCSCTADWLPQPRAGGPQSWGQNSKARSESEIPGLVLRPLKGEKETLASEGNSGSSVLRIQQFHRHIRNDQSYTSSQESKPQHSLLLSSLSSTSPHCERGERRAPRPPFKQWFLEWGSLTTQLTKPTRVCDSSQFCFPEAQLPGFSLRSRQGSRSLREMRAGPWVVKRPPLATHHLRA